MKEMYWRTRSRGKQLESLLEEVQAGTHGCRMPFFSCTETGHLSTAASCDMKRSLDARITFAKAEILMLRDGLKSYQRYKSSNSVATISDTFSFTGEQPCKLNPRD